MLKVSVISPEAVLLERFNMSGEFMQVLNNGVRVVTEKATAA